MEKIGLALGGGGAKGFAHLPILEAFDELGVKPACITGTSIGAIMGGLYASGKSAVEIKQIIDTLIVSRQPRFRELFRNKDTFKFLQLIDPNLKPGGLIKGERFLSFLCDTMHASTFESLQIPLKTVATDFWNRKQVVFDSGDLLHAIRASMAIPYIFTPVFHNGSILVDGGLVNNLPHDLLDADCSITVAVDISGDVSTKRDKTPTPVEAVFQTTQIMSDAVVRAKLEQHPVDIYVQSPLLDVEMLDFHKAEEIYAQGLAAKDAFKRQLASLLETPKKRNWLRRKR